MYIYIIKVSKYLLKVIENFMTIATMTNKIY